MAVILVEINGLLGEGFIVAVVILNARLVNDDFCVLNHVVADIHLGVQAVGPGNGHVAVDADPAFEILTVENKPCERVSMSPAKTDQSVFMESPSGQIGGKGGLSGAWDAEIHVEHMCVSGTEEGPEKNGQVNEPGQKKNRHKNLLSHAQKTLEEEHASAEEAEQDHNEENRAACYLL